MSKGALPGDTPCPRPQTPPCKAWLGSFPASWLVLVPSGAGLSLGTVWAQLEDQSVQMEQLKQELDARRDELEQAQRSLSHAKQVRGWGQHGPRAPQTLSQGLDLPPLLSLSFSSSPGSCHGAESGPSPSVS